LPSQRTAFDSQQVDAAPREGREGLVEAARSVLEGDDEGDLVAACRRSPPEQREAGEILHLILEIAAQDSTAIESRRPPAADRRAARIVALAHAADACRGIVRRLAAEVWVGGEEATALSEGDGMRLDALQLGDAGPGCRDEMVAYRDDLLADDMKRAREEQLEAARDRADQRVLERRHGVVDVTAVDLREQRLEARAGDEVGVAGVEAARRRFAERSRLALEGHPETASCRPMRGGALLRGDIVVMLEGPHRNSSAGPAC
jgi:hypothetical protein